DAHRLAGGEDIELVGIEDEAPALADRLPEIVDLQRGLRVDVDEARMPLGAEAYGLAVTRAREVDAQRHLLQALRRALPEARLRQARAGAGEDREGAGRDLGIERSLVAGRDLVELARAVGDDAHEDVETAGGAL